MKGFARNIDGLAVNNAGAPTNHQFPNLRTNQTLTTWVRAT